METLEEMFTRIRDAVKRNPDAQHRVSVENYARDISLDGITVTPVRTGWVKYEFFIFDASMITAIDDENG